MSAGIEVDIDPESEDLAFYENTGSAWYRRAVNVSASLVGVGPEFLLDVADRYNQAPALPQLSRRPISLSARLRPPGPGELISGKRAPRDDVRRPRAEIEDLNPLVWRSRFS